MMFSLSQPADSPDPSDSPDITDFHNDSNPLLPTTIQSKPTTNQINNNNKHTTNQHNNDSDDEEEMDEQVREIVQMGQQTKHQSNSTINDVNHRIRQQHETMTIELHPYNSPQSTSTTTQQPGALSILFRQLLVLLLFAYLVVIPCILVLTYYLNWLEVLEVAIVAITSPLLVYRLIWWYTTRRFPMVLQRRITSTVIVGVVTRHWLYEIYQLLLTLLSCSTYLYYTYHLYYTIDSTTGIASYTLSIPSVTSFVQCEYFVICSLSIDYLIRYSVAKSRSSFVLSSYSLIDLSCFTGVAYFSFYHTSLVPHAVYNYYLLQGPIRFLRMRRALKSLDEPIQSSSTHRDILYRLGPFKLTRYRAGVLLLAARVSLYIACTAAVILACEFPCISFFTPEQQSKCFAELQSFHLCVYFTIVTLATVGYGDIHVVTDTGRIVMSLIIVFAVIQVPRELQQFHAKQQQWGKNKRRAEAIQMTEKPRSTVTDPLAPDVSPSFFSPSPAPSYSPSPIPSSASTLSSSSPLPSLPVLHSDLQYLSMFCELQIRRFHNVDTVRQMCAAVKVDEEQWKDDEIVTKFVQALLANNTERKQI